MAPMADSASALLDRLRKTDVDITARDDRLVLDGPDSALTDALVAEVRSHKPALLAVLASRSPAPRVEDGCTAHTVTAEAVARRWAEAERRDLRPGFCSCCSGPAQPQMLVCRWCEALTPEREEELTRAPPCVRCGASGYTCDASLAWYCEPCWRASR